MALAAPPPLSCCSRPAAAVLARLFSLFSRTPAPSSPFPSSHDSIPRSRFLFSTSSSPRTRHALRPPGLVQGGPEDEDDDASDSEGSAKKSRNALKREARRAVRWGMELATFSSPQIKRVLRVASLEREVFDALMLVKRLGPDVREGKRRQFNYIGRLLRKAQPELMDALIQASKDGDDKRLNALSGQQSWSSEYDEEEDYETAYEEEEEEGCDSYVEVAAKWFDGLIYKDSTITNEVFSVHNVDFDRQELRKLVRRVQLTQERLVFTEAEEENNAMLARAKKPLIHFLRSLAKKSLAE